MYAFNWQFKNIFGVSKTYVFHRRYFINPFESVYKISQFSQSFYISDYVILSYHSFQQNEILGGAVIRSFVYRTAVQVSILHRGSTAVNIILSLAECNSYIARLADHWLILTGCLIFLSLCKTKLYLVNNNV